MDQTLGRQDEAGLDRGRLFMAGVLALFTAGLCAALRASTAASIKAAFLDGVDPLHAAELTAGMLGAAFLGFAFTLFCCSPLIDRIGMRRLLGLAAAAFVGGAVLAVGAGEVARGRAVYHCLWAAMLLQGFAWGAVESVINPMTTTLYPEDRTHRLNVLHAWWPMGLIVGGLIGFAAGGLGVDWRAVFLAPIVPAGLLLWAIAGQRFPATERVQAGVGTRAMFAETLRRPSFLIWLGAMLATAATELAPGQWVDVALSSVVGMRGILLLVYVSGLMFLLRHFAGPLVHRLSEPGLLAVSSALACAGLLLLSRAHTPAAALVGATVWGAGVCYMWPTMLAAVAGRYPRGGAWMIGLMGSAGALSIYFVLPRLGALYDQAKLEAAGGPEALATLQGPALDAVLAQAAAASFQAVAAIPAGLTVLFTAIWWAERRRGQAGAVEARTTSS